MLRRFSTGHDFLKGIEGVPVTIDQWQLEKLALSADGKEVLYCVPGLPASYHAGLWGEGFCEPPQAIHALFDGLKPGSRVAVIPEGPYVLAQVR
jgi:hypothetical protein